MTAKRLPVPATFLAVVLAVIFLIIFFGAWAASADAEGGERKLTLGFTGGAVATSATNVSSSEATSQGSLDQEAEEASWWGSAFLSACPFH